MIQDRKADVMEKLLTVMLGRAFRPEGCFVGESCPLSLAGLPFEIVAHRKLFFSSESGGKTYLRFLLNHHTTYDAALFALDLEEGGAPRISSHDGVFFL